MYLHEGCCLVMLVRQCGRVVRAPDLKSGGPGFKFRLSYLELYHGRPGFDSSATLVNSNIFSPGLSANNALD